MLSTEPVASHHGEARSEGDVGDVADAGDTEPLLDIEFILELRLGHLIDNPLIELALDVAGVRGRTKRMCTCRFAVSIAGAESVL